VPDWIAKVQNEDTNNKEWFTDSYYAEDFGPIANATGTVEEARADYVKIAFQNEKKVFDRETESVILEEFTDYKEYAFDAEKGQKTTLEVGDVVSAKDKIASGDFTNDTFYMFIGRILLLSLFLLIAFVVYLAYKKREREGRTTL